MGSAHPPLESLLTFSQTCLAGFENSRLNRISNLRKELRELVDEWIEFEIEARLARWILDDRQSGAADCLPQQTRAPEIALPQMTLPSLARAPGHVVLPWDDDPAPQLPPGSTLELRDTLTLAIPPDSTLETHDHVALELHLPFRRVSVSYDASAALHSLEHFARCEARSIRDHQNVPLNFAPYAVPVLDPFLPFPEIDPSQALRRNSAPTSQTISIAIHAANCVVEHDSLDQPSDQGAAFEPVAQLALNFVPRLHRRVANWVDRCSFLVCSSRSYLRHPVTLGPPPPLYASRHGATLSRH
jgi:hypothetical protein